MRHLHFCAHGQFPADDLLRQAVEAERAALDGSDHLQLLPRLDGSRA